MTVAVSVSVAVAVPTLMMDSLVHLVVDSLHYWHGVCLHVAHWNLHVLDEWHLNDLLNGNWVGNVYMNHLFIRDLDDFFYWVGNRFVNFHVLDFDNRHRHVSDDRHLNRVGLWDGHLYGLRNRHRHGLWHTVHLFPEYLVRLLPDTVAHWNVSVNVGSVVNVINDWALSTSERSIAADM